MTLGPASNFIDTHGRVRIWILIAQRVPILSIALSNQGDHFYQADLARRQVTNFVWARLVVLIAVASVWVWSILHRLVHVNALSVPAVALVRRLADVHEWSCLLQSVRLRLSRNLELFSGLLGGSNFASKGSSSESSALSISAFWTYIITRPEPFLLGSSSKEAALS